MNAKTSVTRTISRDQDGDEMQQVFSIQGDEWLDRANCKDLDIKDFFVEAGHVIEDSVLNTCKTCPVRRECVMHAYRREVTGGYFGGLSPGQRRDMTLDEALEFIKTDGPNLQENAEVEPEDEDFDYR